ncbi:MAG: cation:proton antiporter [Dehalococcoidia bacterium]
MAAISLTNLVIVCAVAVAAPLLLGLSPALRLPAVVLEIMAGIVIGPSGLGWVTADAPVQVLALIGLAFLLFLAGLEVEFDRLRGPALRLALSGFGASAALALTAGAGLGVAGIVETPLLVAIILLATSLGVVVPILKDAGESATAFGQTVIAGGSVADVAAIVLLSLFFSRQGGGGSQALLLGAFAATGAAVALALTGAARSMRLSMSLLRVQDTTAQIRVRGAFLLLAGFAALAELLGLEVILGAFLAGIVLTVIDRDRRMTHPLFRTKLEAAGFGVFIPVFFVASGLRFDLAALLSGPAALARAPLFLAALLLVRGLPALLYRSRVGGRRALAAALLQATSLPFIVAATQIGLDLGMMSATNAAALVAAGLLSVLLFPLGAATLLRGAGRTVGPAPLPEPLRAPGA